VTLIREPQGDALLARYRSTYSIAHDAELTEQMVRRHWDLERRLTRELLASTVTERPQLFERCYTTLYRELPWLNEPTLTDAQAAEIYAGWPGCLGPPPSDVYEVGSGSGALARFLALRGYRCRASEITPERGQSDDGSDRNPSWGPTDGVHLTRFEARASHDVVISNQVIEHLHPADLAEHLRSVAALLRPGGRYVFSTPHAYLGPSDVSAVFRRRRPEGMHLKEYTYRELCRALRDAGFCSLAAPLRGRPSRGYLTYLRAVEAVLRLVPSQFVRRTLALRGLRPPLFSRDVMIVAMDAT